MFFSGFEVSWLYVLMRSWHTIIDLCDISREGIKGDHSSTCTCKKHSPVSQCSTDWLCLSRAGVCRKVPLSNYYLMIIVASIEHWIFAYVYEFASKFETLAVLVDSM